jgi:hypothetical protein
MRTTRSLLSIALTVPRENKTFPTVTIVRAFSSLQEYKRVYEVIAKQIKEWGSDLPEI